MPGEVSNVIMDPVTVIGLVAGIVQLIDTTTKAIKYINDVKDAPRV
jgi:hypothetical protein